MPEITIKEVVYQDLPMLKNPDSDGLISKQLEFILIELKEKFAPKKDNWANELDFKSEDSYNELERLFLGKYTAYELLYREVLKEKSKTEASEGLTKKEKVDVLEIEYFEKKDSNTFILENASILANLKSKICELSRQVGIPLVLCNNWLKNGKLPIYFNTYP